jgi:iron complex outermembrane receptor protein
MTFLPRRYGLMMTTALAPALLAGAAMAQTAEATAIEEIVVTATRQAQSLSRVPVSVSAYSQERMDRQGVKSVDDIARLTPGINFSQGRLGSSISIRGIASSAGAATTGIYIDDTPIQVRALGTSSSNTYPIVFDLERVEVLRGPQGTLFGAGSQGGTMRFIQPEPSLTSRSVYGRGELATTQQGGMSYEAGVATGGPIVEDKLGFRASVFYRREGGWVDRQTGTATVLDSTGRSGVNSVLFTPTGTYEEDSNWGESMAARLALAWAPTEDLTITPSLQFQKQFDNNHIYSFWATASNYGSSRFVDYQPVPVVDATHISLPGAKLNEPFKDKFLLPAMKVEWDLGPVRFASNTSYFKRDSSQQPNYTQLYEQTYARRQVPLPGDFVVSPANNHQKTFTQEIRLHSDMPESRLNWVVGAFYQKATQTAEQDTQANFINKVSSIANAAIPGYPTPLPAVNNGAPFGPGYSAYVNYYGMDLLNGVTTYYHLLETKEEQMAVFGQADFAVTEKLKITAGVRLGRNELTLDPEYNGPNSNLNTPRGYACVPGTGSPGAPACVPVEVGQYKPGEGPFALAFVTDPSSAKEKSFTPKLGISYQADERNMFYATVAKGFRPGGAQQRQPSTCNDQLTALGYVNAAGRPESPTTYDSDTVWSYEAGSKNRLFGGRVQLDASAYYIKWKDIQTSVSVSTCAQSFFDNLGSATSKGFDVQAQWEAIDNLVLGAVVGYTNASFDDDTVMGGRRLFSGGAAIPGSPPPWVATLSGQYDFTVLDSLDAYVRSDINYRSEARRTGNRDSRTVSYDPMLKPVESYTVVNARAGVRLEGADISLFVNNLTNAHPSLSMSRTNGQSLYTDWTLRPRTAGITVSYRY